MKVYFYLPPAYLPSAGADFPLGESGKIQTALNWVYQTWQQLKDQTNLSLTSTLPEAGVILTMGNILPANFRANEAQFVVAIAADHLPHPGAQLQILQNRAHANRLSSSFFMPHWTQPGLLPRDPKRGDRFETLAFFGEQSNLAPELAGSAWPEELHRATGLTLELRGVERWHDYSTVDVVLGMRDFQQRAHLHKPATKLCNAWIAGVPFIGGSDSACRAERRSELDYLEARSPADLLEQLRHLRDDPERRRAIALNGQKRGREFEPATLRRRWLDFLETELPAAVRRWESKGTLARRGFWAKQRLLFFADRKLRS